MESRSSKGVSQQGRYGSMLGSVLTIDPLTPVYYTDPQQFAPGMLEAYEKGQNIMKDPVTGYWYATSKYVDDDNGSPFIQRDKTDSTNEGLNFRGTLYANFTPFKDSPSHPVSATGQPSPLPTASASRTMPPSSPILTITASRQTPIRASIISGRTSRTTSSTSRSTL